eukprot:CAMPEP_0172039136 /NCGR_PEP_ID=MMETSP1041-20130122/23723_1 /TAXON_ID=464988 /ORGANISM="Hemiselmis andersenii, Strain CCMP439" /LENGTH=47 /DNA_ID= /DNA_START= /DNA_END= /DNA_ORIENTATION=
MSSEVTGRPISMSGNRVGVSHLQRTDVHTSPVDPQLDSQFDFRLPAW